MWFLRVSQQSHFKKRKQPRNSMRLKNLGQNGTTLPFIWHKTAEFLKTFFYFIWPRTKFLPATSRGEKNKVPVTRRSHTVNPNYPFKSSTGKCYCSNTGIIKKKNKQQTLKGHTCALSTPNSSDWVTSKRLSSASYGHTHSPAAVSRTAQNSCGHISSCLQQPLAEGNVGGTEGWPQRLPPTSFSER